MRLDAVRRREVRSGPGRVRLGLGQLDVIPLGLGQLSLGPLAVIPLGLVRLDLIRPGLARLAAGVGGTLGQRRSSRCLQLTQSVARGKACRRALGIGLPQVSQRP